MSRTLKAFALASVLAGAMAATAHSHTTGYNQMLTDYHVNSIMLGARSQGYTALVADHRGQTDTGTGAISFVVMLQAGQDYRFATTCAAGCNGVRMSLLNAAGNELVADRDDQEWPRFNIRATYTGAYVVTIQAASCLDISCNLGAVVLTRGTPSPEAGQLPHMA